MQIWHFETGDLPHLGQRSARHEMRAGHDGQSISLDDVESPGAAVARICLPLFFVGGSAGAALRGFSGAGERSWADMSRAAFAPINAEPDFGKS